MATPLRFRYSPDRWTEARVIQELHGALDANLGATCGQPWYKLDAPYETRRFDMDNGDTALFAWNDSEAYWLGNTETPRALWRTNKVGFAEAPDEIADWAEREFLAELLEAEPWLEPYPALARFFLPILAAKDGREANRAFFRDHAVGFPDTDMANALAFYDEFLASDALDGHRHVMAGKLGTSDNLHDHRLAAAMSEFTVAKLLVENGFSIEPEAAVGSGHAIDFRVNRGSEGTLVEVTRPSAPADRAASTAVSAIRETVSTKTDDQLAAHGGGVTLFVDCSSFGDGAWRNLLEAKPDVGHKPAIVFRVRPGSPIEGYQLGGVPIGLDVVIEQ